MYTCLISFIFRGHTILYPGTSLAANGRLSGFVTPSVSWKLCFHSKGSIKARALLGEDGLRSYPNGNPTGSEIQPDALCFGTLSAETTPTFSGFSSENDEGDLDHPIHGFSSIPVAIEDIRQGKVGHFLNYFCWEIKEYIYSFSSCA